MEKQLKNSFYLTALNFQDGSKPKKVQLGVFDFTMIVIGLVIGMGIFRTAKDAASAAINPTVYFSAWIIGGIIALCGALTYAEIGSRYPVTGGYYKCSPTHFTLLLLLR